MNESISSWHVGIAAEAFSAGMFARCGYDVSVQYGANQPEYDLIVVNKNQMLKVSVKGSQDGRWGLTQSFKKGLTYHAAADMWLSKHHKGTIYCFVQFKDVNMGDMPRIYLATPNEVSDRLKNTAKGRGSCILYENQEWGKLASGYGTIDAVPKEWLFTPNRIEELFTELGV